MARRNAFHDIVEIIRRTLQTRPRPLDLGLLRLFQSFVQGDAESDTLDFGGIIQYIRDADADVDADAELAAAFRLAFVKFGLFPDH